jgi:hypothetical protein
VQVIVLRVAIIMLEDTSTAQVHTPEKTRFDHLTERPVDGRATDLAGTNLARQIGDQVVGVKMLVLPKDLFDDHPPLPRIPHPLTLEILFEPVEGLLCDANRIEIEFLRHRPTSPWAPLPAARGTAY